MWQLLLRRCWKGCSAHWWGIRAGGALLGRPPPVLDSGSPPMALLAPGGAEADASPHGVATSLVSSGAYCCLFAGRICPWEEEVWCWVQQWSGKHTKRDVNQLGITGWKCYDAWRSCTLTINTRCTTHLCLNSQSSFTAVWVSPWFVWFKMAQLQF